MNAREQRADRLRRRAAHQAWETVLLAAGTPPLVAYWEARYHAGGTSGNGSAGQQALAKARYVNDLIRREHVTSVVDWGCGDGHQLDLFDLPLSYLGVDVAPSAVVECARRHPRRAFVVWPADQPGVTVRADLALSLDVVFHLTRDADFETYWSRLFDSAQRLVLVHATDHDARGARHVRHRRHSHLAPDGWTLADAADDPTEPGFYLWRRA